MHVWLYMYTAPTVVVVCIFMHQYFHSKKMVSWAQSFWKSQGAEGLKVQIRGQQVGAKDQANLVEINTSASHDLLIPPMKRLALSCSIIVYPKDSKSIVVLGGNQWGGSLARDSRTPSHSRHLPQICGGVPAKSPSVAWLRAIVHPT